MTENDFKIGNLVKLFRNPEDSEMTIFSIKSIYLEENNEPCYFVELNDGFCVNVSALRGVELSNDLLAIYGFEFYQNPNNHPSFVYRIAKDNNFLLCKTVFPEIKWTIHEPRIYPRHELKYFHEVQNMYYEVYKERLSLI